jgi:hypothetical protein
VTRAKISQYSATANDNTDVNGTNIAEGCPPSSMNNMGREIMAALKRFQVGSDGDGVTVGGALVVSGATTLTTVSATVVQSDTVSEKTSAAGVTIDGVLLKDNGVVTGAGTVSAPVYSTTGDTNTGIFFPAADTIAFAEGGAEAMRIDSAGNVGIGTSSPGFRLDLGGGTTVNSRVALRRGSDDVNQFMTMGWNNISVHRASVALSGAQTTMSFNQVGSDGTRTAMFIDSSGNVGIGTSSPGSFFDGARNLVVGSGSGAQGMTIYAGTAASSNIFFADGTSAPAQYIGQIRYFHDNNYMMFVTNDGERMRIDSSGNLLFNSTSLIGSPSDSVVFIQSSGTAPLRVNRNTNDGALILFYQAETEEGNISVSGNTVSYNAFCGGHWTQLQEGRGYNPDIPRGTVMSSIGEMAVWKSVEWTETVEHPAVEAVEAVEAVLDEDGNVIEPAVEAVEGKEAWTETFNKREAYLGNLDIGATFEEDGFTKTVVDDGNERLPKVKISDVVGDKAVYGVFQTWDEAQDMLISSLGAFVVRIASGVTVEVGDLLESNGDGCAKVQDDDIIRSKTIGKVTSTVATDTYDDGSYTVPCVLYCG